MSGSCVPSNAPPALRPSQREATNASATTSIEPVASWCKGPAVYYHLQPGRGFPSGGRHRPGRHRTVAPELPEASVTPTIEPGLVATPATQTEQDVQTRNVAGDTVDSWLEIDATGT